MKPASDADALTTVVLDLGRGILQLHLVGKEEVEYALGVRLDVAFEAAEVFVDCLVVLLLKIFEEGVFAVELRIRPRYARLPEFHQPLRWPGHYYDAETGLHENRFRTYSPELCRYLQSDPLGVAGGVNLYAYTDNPTRAVDLNGLAPPPKCADKTVPTKQEDGSDKEIAARRPLWSATKKLRSVENALGHFQKHGEEFHGIQNAKQYVEVATQFVRFPPPGTLTKVRSNGDVILYHPESNTFGVRDGNGIPRTMYKPDPTKHGFPTNMDYFNEQ